MSRVSWSMSLESLLGQVGASSPPGGSRASSSIAEALGCTCDGGDARGTYKKRKRATPRRVSRRVAPARGHPGVADAASREGAQRDDARTRVDWRKVFAEASTELGGDALDVGRSTTS